MSSRIQKRKKRMKKTSIVSSIRVKFQNTETSKYLKASREENLNPIQKNVIRLFNCNTEYWEKKRQCFQFQEDGDCPYKSLYPDKVAK